MFWTPRFWCEVFKAFRSGYILNTEIWMCSEHRDLDVEIRFEHSDPFWTLWVQIMFILCLWISKVLNIKSIPWHRESPAARTSKLNMFPAIRTIRYAAAQLSPYIKLREKKDEKLRKHHFQLQKQCGKSVRVFFSGLASKALIPTPLFPEFF